MVFVFSYDLNQRSTRVKLLKSLVLCLGNRFKFTKKEVKALKVNVFKRIIHETFEN